MRPHKVRRIGFVPRITVYQAQGDAANGQTVLALDMLEAMRLVDAEGLSQEDAASSMGISTPTLCRILAQGRHQTALALTTGSSLVIAGGNVAYSGAARRQGRGSGPGQSASGTGPSRGSGRGPGHGGGSGHGLHGRGQRQPAAEPCIGRPPVQPGQSHKTEPRAQPMAPPADTATPLKQSINPLAIEMLRRSLVSFLPGRARVRHAALRTRSAYEALRKALLAGGIAEVQFTAATGSALLLYEARRLDNAAFFAAAAPLGEYLLHAEG